MTGPSAATGPPTATDPPDASRATAATARPRPRVVLALLAGRGAFRSAVYIAGLALLAIWGQREFAAYAAPAGALAWFTVAVSSGPEKAALTLIPRRGGAQLQPFLRTLAVAGLATPLAVWLLLGAGDTTVRYAASATFAGGLGCATVLVAFYRLRGAPLVDSAAFLTIAVAYAVAVVLAARFGAGPGQVLTLLAVVGLAVNAGLLAGLARRDRARRTPAPGVDAAEGWPSRNPLGGGGEPQSPRIPRRAALRATVVLGVAELLSTAGASALYALPSSPPAPGGTERTHQHGTAG